ncbi:hypothetical protein O6H91_03G115100 [Diphasiastrum complanatum]|uniref:Uncharacterized protein n=8 Tax=Diphasiastrum complanatum TaxID=34168 RepID=A0ACC2EAQ7_DIPCM|nr:hypothetical protein O6H91_03G115100 [Diphasiastrum complanatum]KAJ7563555.1 hypothetical protein O6H91_03G115100 [Diphasiastrum complanatum]KAJ7563556.1 hypothetical protein O6H91_03G115100 [Diphasiastrum complanatum]KAJ7563557.1 hypothetical protein O6H91_03G115100 [Diphasiastrum complanatum]KAJ7563558.1 hypothetical protein O6H91_03G115100 [Diphasiastrum complanatum]
MPAATALKHSEGYLEDVTPSKQALKKQKMGLRHTVDDGLNLAKEATLDSQHSSPQSAANGLEKEVSSEKGLSHSLNEEAPSKIHYRKKSLKKYSLNAAAPEHISSPLKERAHRASLKLKTGQDKVSPKQIYSLETIRLHLASYFIAFLLAAALGAAIWRWKDFKSNASDYPVKSRLEELEEFSKKTTKWIQVQLDLVDMKIDKQMESLSQQLAEQVDERSLALEKKLDSLKLQVDGLDTLLARLREQDFLTRQEVEKLVESLLPPMPAGDGLVENLSLDQVRAIARQLVHDELDKHAADGIGRVDYALGSGGGRVLNHSEGFYAGIGWGSLLGLNFVPGTYRLHHLASKILEPSFGQPGQCLPLAGSSVFVNIALRTAIYPEALTWEHVSKRVAYDLTSAPKQFQVFGWHELLPSGENNVKDVGPIISLGEFTYDVDKRNIQTFNFLAEASKQPVNRIKLHVLSNHGNDIFTCIYRVRIHGTERN